MQVPEATAAPPPNKWQHPATITTKPPKPSIAPAIAALKATAPAALKAWEGMATIAKPKQPKLHHEAAVTTVQQA